MTESDPRAMLARFGLPDVPLTPVDGGLINGSWRAGAFLLQRINPQVFPDGGLVVRNVSAVSEYLGVAAARLGLQEPERRILQVIPARNGAPGVQADDGAWWRVVRFIEGTRTLRRAESPEMALEAGRAFGLFQRLLSGYDSALLAETIPGFHDTRRRLQALTEAVSRDPAHRVREVGEDIRFAESRAGYADVLPPLVVSGDLPVRVVHNDAKIGNVLFDDESLRSLAVIDLDTVMPGTLLSDVGDLIRSMASASEEDEPDLTRITVSPSIVEALLRGFLEGCGSVLVPGERALLIFSGILLSYEQGVRFLTDYLEGDRYYRTARPGQNLDRARAQFGLVAELEKSRALLERRVLEIGRR